MVPKISSSLMMKFEIPLDIEDLGKSSSVMRKSSDTRFASSETPQAESAPFQSLSPELWLRLSWTHLIELIRLDHPAKRAFYENGCLKGNWSVRQLQRQIGSLLYERTGLPKAKKAIIRRAHRQEPHEAIQDL